jgi:hypothetical protein
VGLADGAEDLRYLRAHPDKANALNVSTFRFLRQVTVGMDQEQVLILLGPPVEVTENQMRMEQVARRYWPQIQGNATLVWTYLEGWAIYFAGQKVVDITQYYAPGSNPRRSHDPIDPRRHQADAVCP